MTATVSFSNNHRLPALGGYQSSGEVDLDKFLPVYRALRAYLDVDPSRQPFQYSVKVFSELKAAGWDPDEAKHYAHAARLACVENLDPETGRPLTGIAAVHPFYAEVAAVEIEQILEDVVADERTMRDVAQKIVVRMADLGWRPGV